MSLNSTSNGSNKDVLILSIEHTNDSSDSSIKSITNGSIIEIKTNGDLVTPSIVQNGNTNNNNNNISKINLDYTENIDNKTIISLNGDGGEILWDSNHKIPNSASNSISINTSADEEEELGPEDPDDENGEEFNLSDSEFEEILDDDDDDDDQNDFHDASSDHVDSGCGGIVKNTDDNGSYDSSIVKDIIDTVDIIQDNDKNVIKIINNYRNELDAHDSVAAVVNLNNNIDNNDDDVEVNNLVNKIEINQEAHEDENCIIINNSNSDKNNCSGLILTCSDKNIINDSDNNNSCSNTDMLNETINARLINHHHIQQTSTPINNNRSPSITDEHGAEILATLQPRRKSLHTSNHQQYLLHDNNGGPSQEDDEVIVNILGKDNEVAEARLAARRQARAEAREIRMRELERQQKEQEQNADRVFDMQTAAGIDPLSRSRIAALSTPTTVATVRGNSMSSRRSSEDSLEEEGRSLRDLRHEIKEVEERFRKAMIANAQLDNERSSQSYQIQLLKDKLEEMEESHAQLQREYREKSRDHDALKRNNDKLQEELKLVQGQLNERDTLIAEQGLVIVTIEDENGTDARRALVSAENAHLLETTQGSLDVRLKKFAADRKQYEIDIQQLQQQLSEVRIQGRRTNSMNGPTNGDDDHDVPRDSTNKLLAESKYKLQKVEQENLSLQASLARSETQVIRYKSTAEAAEKAEAELKIERRKLQRENREAMERIEELETANNHLLKRMDKLKNAKSTLLKEL